MSFGIYFYLVSIIIFAGGACLIQFLMVRKEIRPYWRLLPTMALMGLVITVILEPAALALSAWSYNPQYVLNIHILNAEIETFLYSILVVTTVSMAAIVWANDEDKGHSLIKATWKRMKNVLK